MKDMNWPERVAYLENQLADSDRENQRLSEFIKGLPDGDETPAQLAEAQRFRRSTMYWHERAMKAEARLAEAEALLREAVDVVESCHDCIRIDSPELHARINAYLSRKGGSHE